MAAGDAITDDWQVELPGSYLIGSGQAVGIVRIDGLEALPEMRVADVPRPRAAGSFALPQYPAERVVTIDVEVARTAAATMREVVDAWNAATVPAATESAIVYQLPGTGKRRLVGRVRRRTLPVDRGFGFGRAIGSVQIVASDPRILDNVETSGSTGVGSVTGGLGFPHGFPHGFGAATAGAIAIDNAGNTPAPWTATLAGPLTSPRITVVGGDGDLELNGFDLADGQTIELDSAARTVLLNGTASRYSSLTRRVWFELPVGASLVQLGAASGTGTLTVRYRSAWL
jgi:hypothetical protein